MSYYRVCPYCGANLDPGERCDCRRSRMKTAYGLLMKLSDNQLDQLMTKWGKDTARSADDTTDGRETTHDT